MLMSGIYGNMLFDLALDLADDLYYEVYEHTLSMEVGSEKYFQEYAKHTQKWLDSDVYRQKVAMAFNDSGGGGYRTYNGTQTFEDFVDDVYDEFGFEELFIDIFPLIYNETYDALVTQGYVTINSVDHVGMTTDYMR